MSICNECWGNNIPYSDLYDQYDRMDWYNDEDRIAMVKDGNFSCSYEFEPDDCETCPARKWCDRYEVMRWKDEKSITAVRMDSK